MEPDIYTRRLRLRKPVLADARDIFYRYATDAEVTRYLAWRPHESEQVTIDFLRQCRSGWEKTTGFTWVLEMDGSGVIGMIDIHSLSETGGALGFVLARSYWGRSLMTEAARSVASLAREHGIRLRSYVHADNLASIKVLKNAGLERVGLFHKVLFLPNLGMEDRQPGVLFEEPMV